MYRTHLFAVASMLLSVLCQRPTVATAAAAPVQVDFYGEALCPYCARFLTQIASAAFEDKVMDLANFTYVAWGNAVNSTTQKGPVCQHGPVECSMDRVINCAIALNPGQGNWFPFVSCLEQHPGSQMASQIQPCAEQARMDAKAINACAAGDQGDSLEAEAAEQTANLKPAHRYVPWVVVNGIPLGEDYANLAKVICAAAGPEADRPEACFKDPDSPSMAVGFVATVKATIARAIQSVYKPWGVTTATWRPRAVYNI
jgi:interferon gamma-inducible protein 30